MTCISVLYHTPNTYLFLHWPAPVLIPIDNMGIPKTLSLTTRKQRPSSLTFRFLFPRVLSSAVDGNKASLSKVCSLCCRTPLFPSVALFATPSTSGHRLGEMYLGRYSYSGKVFSSLTLSSHSVIHQVNRAIVLLTPIKTTFQVTPTLHQSDPQHTQHYWQHGTEHSKQ